MTKWRRLERGFTRPITTRPLARREGTARQWQWQRSRGDRVGDDSPGGNPARGPGARSGTAFRATPRGPAPGSSATREPAPHHARATGRARQVTVETAPELEGRELLRRYGRDPRRPDWVDAERGVASAHRVAGRWHWQRAEPERRARRRHQSVCATCGQTAETTFRPDPTRPVYCDGCYHEVRETRRAAVASPAV